MEEDDIPTFAARIKAKYPDYASVDDYELVEKVVRKHPVYASQVKLPEGFGLLYTSSGYGKIDSIYEEMGRKYNVDPNLLLEQGRQETSFDPDVFYGKRASSAGAVGAGQFMPGTAPKYGVTDRTDPIQSIEGQAKYMRKLLDDFDNDESLALAGYNAGEYRKALTKDRRVPNIPETQHYVKTIKEKLDEARSKSKRLRDFIQQSPSVQAPTPTTQPTTQPTPEAPSAFEAQLTVARDPKNMARSGVFFPNDGTNAALKYANGLDSNWALFPDKKHNGTHLINLAKAKKLKLRTPKEIQEFIDKNPNAFKTLGIAVEDVGNDTQGVAITAENNGVEHASAVVRSPETAVEQINAYQKQFPDATIRPTTTDDIVQNRIATLGGTENVPPSTEPPMTVAGELISDPRQAGKTRISQAEQEKTQDVLQARFAELRKTNPSLTVDQFNQILSDEHKVKVEKSKQEWLAKNPALAKFAKEKNLDPFAQETVNEYNASRKKYSATKSTAKTQFDEASFNQANKFLREQGQPELSREEFIARQEGNSKVGISLDPNTFTVDGTKITDYEIEAPAQGGGTIRFPREVGKGRDANGTVAVYRSEKGMSEEDAYRAALLNAGSRYGITPEQVNAQIDKLKSAGKKFFQSGKHIAGNMIAVTWDDLANVGVDVNRERRMEQSQNTLVPAVDVGGPQLVTAPGGTRYAVANKDTELPTLGEFVDQILGDRDQQNNLTEQRKKELEYRVGETQEESEAAEFRANVLKSALANNFSLGESEVITGFGLTAASYLSWLGAGGADLTDKIDPFGVLSGSIVTNALFGRSRGDFLGKFGNKVQKLNELSTPDNSVYKIYREVGNVAGALPAYAAVGVAVGGNPVLTFAITDALVAKGKGGSLRDTIGAGAKGAVMGAMIGNLSRFGTMAADGLLGESLLKVVPKVKWEKSIDPSVRRAISRIWQADAIVQGGGSEAIAAKKVIERELAKSGLTLEQVLAAKPGAVTGAEATAAANEVAKKLTANTADGITTEIDRVAGREIARGIIEYGVPIGLATGIGYGVSAIEGGSTQDNFKNALLFGAMQALGSIFHKKKGEKLTPDEVNKADGTVVRVPDEKGKPHDLILLKENNELTVTDVTGKVPPEAIQGAVLPKPPTPAPTDGETLLGSTEIDAKDKADATNVKMDFEAPIDSTIQKLPGNASGNQVAHLTSPDEIFDALDFGENQVFVDKFLQKGKSKSEVLKTAFGAEALNNTPALRNRLAFLDIREQIAAETDPLKKFAMMTIPGNWNAEHSRLLDDFNRSYPFSPLVRVLKGVRPEQGKFKDAVRNLRRQGMPEAADFIQSEYDRQMQEGWGKPSSASGKISTEAPQTQENIEVSSQPAQVAEKLDVPDAEVSVDETVKPVVEAETNVGKPTPVVIPDTLGGEAGGAIETFSEIEPKAQQDFVAQSNAVVDQMVERKEITPAEATEVKSKIKQVSEQAKTRKSKKENIELPSQPASLEANPLVQDQTVESTVVPKTKKTVTKPVTDEVVETATEEVVEPPKKDKFSNKPLEEVKAEGEVKYDGVDDFFADEEKPAEKVKVNEFKVEPFKGKDVDVVEQSDVVDAPSDSVEVGKGDDVDAKSTTSKTNLDLILDRVTNENEVTLSIKDGISREQIQRVEDAAKARGMTAAFDGHGFLIRKNIEASPKQDVGKSDAPAQLSTKEQAKALRDLGYTLPVQRTLSDVQKADIIAKSIKKQDYVAEKTDVEATPSNRDADITSGSVEAKDITIPAKGTTVYSKGGVEGEVLKVDGDKVVVQWTNKDGEMAGDPVSVDVNKVFTEAPSISQKSKSETQTDLPVTGETQTKGAVKVGDTVENIIGGWKGTIAKNADGDLVVKRGKEVWGDYSPANYVPVESDAKSSDNPLRSIFPNAHPDEIAAVEAAGVEVDREAFERQLEAVEPVRNDKGELLAPNGKVSNLNELEWRTVRTKNFIGFFGDWINDPENASKVVDENGEPLVVVHGSSVDIGDTFLHDRKGDNTGASNTVLGFFFTDSPELADARYAGYPQANLTPVYLSIQNPLKLSDDFEIDPGTAIRDNAREYLDHYPQSEEDWQEYADYVHRKYDGIVFRYGEGRFEQNTYVAFKSNQIKSAIGNNGNFDPAEDSILRSINASVEGNGRDTTNVNALAKEARKFATADEFASAQWKKHTAYKDGHRAPSRDERTFDERRDQGGDFSLLEVADGKHNQADDYFDPRVGARYYGYDNLAGHQSYTAISNIIRAVKSGNVEGKTVTTYRAVPKGVKPESLRDGDWVTFSKQYAIDHGEHRFGENEYRIIEQEVNPADVWWDNNDINEWGYDSGYAWNKSVAFWNAVNNNTPLFKIRSSEDVDALYNVLPYIQNTGDLLEYANGGTITDGELELSPYDAEVTRRLLAEVQKGTDVPASEGAVYNASTLNKMAKVAEAKSAEMTEMGYPKSYTDNLDNLAKNLRTIASNAKHGILYTFDESLPEERFHLEDLSAGRTSKEAIEQMKQSPLWDASEKFNRDYGKLSDRDKASEIVAKLATDQEKAYGWDKIDNFEAERAKLFDTWIDGIIAQNNITDIDAFNKEFTRLGAVYAEAKTNKDRTGKEGVNGNAGVQGGTSEGTNETRGQSEEGNGVQDRAVQGENKEKLASLPKTLRKYGLDAVDVAYTVYGDTEATADAVEMFEKNGIDGSIKLLESIKTPDASHTILEGIVYDTLLNQSLDLQGQAATDLRLKADTFLKNASERHIKAGRYTRAVQLMAHSPSVSVMQGAQSIAESVGNNLSDEQVAKFGDLARELETAFAETQMYKKQRDELKKENKKLAKKLEKVLSEKMRKRASHGRRQILARVENKFGTEIEQAAKDLRKLLAGDVLRSINDGVLRSTRPPLTEKQKAMVDALGNIGAHTLLEGMVADVPFLPETFKQILITQYGQEIESIFPEVYDKAIKTRDKWLKDIAKENQRKVVTTKLEDANFEAEMEKALNRQLPEELTDGDILDILGVSRDIARRQRAIEKMHRLASGVRKTSVTTEMRQMILTTADNDLQAVVAEMVAEGRRPREIYNELKDMPELFGGKFDQTKAEEAFVRGMGIVKEAKQTIKDHQDEIKQEMAAQDKMVSDIDVAELHARKRLDKAKRETRDEYERLKNPKTYYAKKAYTTGVDLLRNLTLSAELSFLMRQGGKAIRSEAITYLVRKPMELAKKWEPVKANPAGRGALRTLLPTSIMGKELGNVGERAYAANVLGVEEHPLYNEAVKFGMDFSTAGKIGHGLHVGEEQLQSEAVDMLVDWLNRDSSKGLATKMPRLTRQLDKGAKVISQYPKMIQRFDKSMAVFLDNLRMKLYERLSNELKAQGYDVKTNRNEFEELVRRINTGTSRPNRMNNFIQKGIDGIVESRIALAPSYTVAKWQDMGADVRNVSTAVVKAVAFQGLPKGTQRIMIKRAVASYGALVAQYALIAVGLGALVSFDPDDDDFLKLKIGNYRRDLTQGNRSELRYIGKLIKHYDNPDKALGSSLKYLRTRLNVLPGFALNAWVGKDVAGQDFSLKDPKRWVGLVAPLTWMNTYGAYKQDGAKGIAGTLPFDFVGYQSSVYPDRVKDLQKQIKEAKAAGKPSADIQWLENELKKQQVVENAEKQAKKEKAAAKKRAEMQKK